ncbi:MAG TPA: hypothetical protein DHV28_07530 [Ignavibacteriales bacterium]|nr:hypothetical protein [Ignavibacteriales bacterium]
MIKTKHTLIFLTAIVLIINSCAPSLVYSPSINLPPKPLQKDEIQLLGGAGYLPETLPDRTAAKMAFGGEATIRYGFNNTISGQIKGWYDFSNNVEQKRWGLSTASIITFNDSSDFRFGVMPNLAMVLSDNSIEGGGGSLPFTFWLNKYNPFNIYFGFGPIVGFRDLTDEANQWGWGLILNTGISILLEERFTLNLEFSGIKQVNEYNGSNEYFLSPSLNIGYIF